MEEVSLDLIYKYLATLNTREDIGSLMMTGTTYSQIYVAMQYCLTQNYVIRTEQGIILTSKGKTYFDLNKEKKRNFVRPLEDYRETEGFYENDLYVPPRCVLKKLRRDL